MKINPLKKMASEGRIVFLEKEEKGEVIKELVEVLAQSPAIGNREELLSSLLEREEIMSTGIGYGLALPHVKIDSISEIVTALGVSRVDLDWGTVIDDLPVRIVVMVGAPGNKIEDYLKVQRGIMKILNQKEVRQKIINARKISEIAKFF